MSGYFDDLPETGISSPGGFFDDLPDYKKGWWDSLTDIASTGLSRNVGTGERVVGGLAQSLADKQAQYDAVSSNPFVQGLAAGYQTLKPFWAPDVIDPNIRGKSEFGETMYDLGKAREEEAQKQLQGNAIPGANLTSNLIGGAGPMAVGIGLAPLTAGMSLPAVFGGQAYGEDYGQGAFELGLTPGETETRAKLGGAGAGALSALPGGGTLAKNVLTGAAQSVGETLGRGGYDVVNDTIPEYGFKELGLETLENAGIGALTAGGVHGLGSLAGRGVKFVEDKFFPTKPVDIISDATPPTIKTGDPDFDQGQKIAADLATNFALEEYPSFTSKFDLPKKLEESLTQKDQFDLSPVRAEQTSIADFPFEELQKQIETEKAYKQYQRQLTDEQFKPVDSLYDAQDLTKRIIDGEFESPSIQAPQPEYTSPLAAAFQEKGITPEMFAEAPPPRISFPSEPDYVSRTKGRFAGAPEPVAVEPQSADFSVNYGDPYQQKTNAIKPRLSRPEPIKLPEEEAAPLAQVNSLQSAINNLRNQQLSSVRPEPAEVGYGVTPDIVTSELNSSSLGKALSKNTAIVSDISELPNGGEGLHPQTQGAYVNGKLYLVANNLKEGTSVPVALHEAVHGVLNDSTANGGRTGMEALLSTKFPDVVERIQALANDGNKVAKAAVERATKNATSPDDVPHEIVSYFAEGAQSARQGNSFLGKAAGVVKDIYSSVKVWAHEKLGTPLSMGVNDIHYILKTASENYSKRAVDNLVNPQQRSPLSSVTPESVPKMVRNEDTANRAAFGNLSLGQRLGLRESVVKSVNTEKVQSPLVTFARNKAPYLEDFARKLELSHESSKKIMRGLLLSDQGKDRLLVKAKDIGSRTAKALEYQNQVFGNRVLEVTKAKKITDTDLRAYEKGGVDAVSPEHKEIFKEYHNKNLQNSLSILDELVKEGNPITKGVVQTAEAIVANAGKYFGRFYLLDKEKGYGENLWHDYTKGSGVAKEKATAIIEPAKQKLGELYLIPSKLGDLDAFKLRDLYQTWVGPLADLRGKVPTKEGMIAALERARINMPTNVNDTLNFLVKQYLGLAGKDPSRTAEYFRNARREEGHLKAREDVPEALRKLAGEITDPVTKMTESLAAQSHFIAQQKSLNALYDMGLKGGDEAFLFKTPAERPGATVRLAGSSFGPLSGLYTSPLVAEALNAQVRMNAHGGKVLDAISRGAVEEILPALLGSVVGRGITGAAKVFRFTHILLNPRNWVLQTMGAPFHMLRAGNFTGFQALDSAKATLGNIGNGSRTTENARTVQMIQGGGSDVSHAADLKTSAKDYKKGVNQTYNQEGTQSFGKKFSHGSENFREVFQAGDQIAKESNRRAELDFWTKYYKAKGVEKTPEQINNEVAERISNVETAYSKVNLLAKSIDKSGAGYFRGYSEDMSRVMKNNYLEGFSDIIKGFQDRKDGNTQSGNMLVMHGAKRLLGSTMATTALRGIQVAVGGAVYGTGLGAAKALKDGWNAAFNDDPRKKALPDYMQDAAPIFAGKDKDGNHIVYDLSPIDPNDPFNRSIMAFAANPTEEQLGKSLKQWLTGVTIDPNNLGMYKTVYDYVNNLRQDKMVRSGLDKVAPNTSKTLQTGIVNRLGLSPAQANVTISALEKELPIKNIAAAYENRNSPLLAAQGFAGFLPEKINPIKDLKGYDAQSFMKTMGEGKNNLKQYFMIPNVSEQVLANAYKEHLQTQMDAFQKIRDKAEGAKALGYSDTDIAKALKEANLPNKMIYSVIKNKFIADMPYAADERGEYYRDFLLDKMKEARPEDRMALRAYMIDNFKTMNKVMDMFKNYSGGDGGVSK